MSENATQDMLNLIVSCTKVHVILIDRDVSVHPRHSVIVVLKMLIGQVRTILVRVFVCETSSGVVLIVHAGSESASQLVSHAGSTVPMPVPHVHLMPIAITTVIASAWWNMRGSWIVVSTLVCVI